MLLRFILPCDCDVEVVEELDVGVIAGSGFTNVVGRLRASSLLAISLSIPASVFIFSSSLVNLASNVISFIKPRNTWKTSLCPSFAATKKGAAFCPPANIKVLANEFAESTSLTIKGRFSFAAISSS